MLILAALCAAILLSAARKAPVFNGSRVKTADVYTLDIQEMNGTDSHTLTLQAGNVLHIELEPAQGELQLEIRSSGVCLYSGNGSLCSAFDLTVPQDGEYTVSVAAKQAAGRVDVRRK